MGRSKVGELCTGEWEAEQGLLVFDTADDPSLSLAPYFLAGDRGDIVVTSRNPECCKYTTVGMSGDRTDIARGL
jgi:hypothetical protein